MLSDWGVEELDALIEELEGETMQGLAAKARMETTPMLALIDSYCERAMRGERVCIATPPQEGKSTRVSVLFAVWAMVQRPGLRVAVASYSLDLAMTFSRRARELCRRLYGPITVAGDDRAANWRIDNGSTYTAVGVGSSFAGKAVDLLIIDDPVRNADEARSERARERVWDWWQSVALTRLSPGAGCVVITTRWHLDDLAGRLIKGFGGATPWESVTIPAQAESGKDPLGRKVGEWLASVRHRSTRDWEQTKASLSTYFWQALYQGSPVALAGRILDSSKLIMTEIGLQEVTGKLGEFNQMWTQVDMDVVQSWDLAFTGSASSDYVSGQVWGIRDDGFYLLDIFHERINFSETVDAVLMMAARWPQTSNILVEKAANGAALISTLSKRLPITPVVPTSSKEIRAIASQPALENGRVKVCLPEDSARVADFKQELDAFPAGAHDDQVDTMTQLLLHYQPGDFYRMG